MVSHISVKKGILVEKRESLLAGLKPATLATPPTLATVEKKRSLLAGLELYSFDARRNAYLSRKAKRGGTC